MSLYNIYILQNDDDLIKIGITQNFTQRLTSLSGSNSGGHKIVNYFVSEPTPLYTLEHIMHNVYAEHRIEGTEWFQDLEFEEVVNALKTFMESEEYRRCKSVRANFERGKNS